MKISYKFEISGLVQGVGFRPFVYSLALRFGIFGNVFNDDSGVKINVYGDKNAIENFTNALKNELPPLARIDEIKIIKTSEIFSDFKIIASKSADKIAPILPDFAICGDCEREFYDKNDPRFLYPFINCTNCGPRFCITKALPYDRKNTTMSVFKMCPNCQSEYENPLNRRYHAQPISCPNCGPELVLKDKNRKILAKNLDAIKMAAELINEGKILAIKGLGGFHLVCSAFDDRAVLALRERKKRLNKPFAVMSKDLKTAKTHAKISQKEEEILISNLKPIVLLKAKNGSKISKFVAPKLDKIGIMLPFSGIHLALFKWLKCDIIATSANISGEPVVFDENSLFRGLGDVFDLYLDHDREIFSPSDDSVAFCVHNKAHFIRTSRGLNPKFLRTNFKIKGTFLALGAELKNQFAIYHNGVIMISPYIGDLKNVATFERFLAILELFVKTYELKFDAVIADLHPHFLNTKWAISQGFKVVKIQHHYAHLLSVIFENNLQLNKGYLGFCFDGTGLGDDDKIWGGEVLKIDKNGYERVLRFDEFSLIGGENSIKNIYKIAISIILKYDLKERADKFLSNFGTDLVNNLEILSKNEKISPKTSSLGRIFDAFACVILGLNEISYEGQSGMELEALYDENLNVSYEFAVCNGVINFKDAFLNALNDEPKIAATALINGLIDLIFKVAKEHNLEILLSGGVFQNSTLLAGLYKKFEQNGIKFHTNLEFCANDSGVSLGQLQYILTKAENGRDY
ncbi:carbamoyltransferase HypF [Campylobacter gastrosuis]|uniref:Carbamoyltransferase n=1 Tax=Campylobacter gastrosuis TaxID=2974576 RepID=A0ABT7HS52_9BACT|nr:carbamoyltransferase HypF [Campylobacter gastrosuis]MDL0089737.1 carbamoyltransferase HypF [Campylobacter gastrosuis]